MELYKDIPGFEGYQASNLGNIRSLDKIVIRETPMEGKEIKGLIKKKTPVFVLSADGRRRDFSQHKVFALFTEDELLLEEFWKPIPEWEESYEASNTGRVKSKDRMRKREMKIKGRVLKQKNDTNGYMSVNLSIGDEEIMQRVHRLVALAHIPNNDILKCEVDHLDANRKNNLLSNLEWVSTVENLRRMRERKFGSPVNK